jgi:hypothetical protein
LTLQSAKATCSHADFINVKEIKIGTDGPQTTLNVKYDIVKEIPQDAIVSTTNLILFVHGISLKTDSNPEGQKSSKVPPRCSHSCEPEVT